MKLMKQTLQQLRKEKEELDDTIAVLERLSRQLEKTHKSVEPEAKPSAAEARTKSEKTRKK